MSDFFRLILVIILIPILVILIGPLLVLAAFRGHQSLGPITLDASRPGFGGQTGMLLAGLTLWLVVWGGLGWLVFGGIPIVDSVAVEITATAANPAALTSPSTADQPLPAASASPSATPSFDTPTAASAAAVTPAGSTATPGRTASPTPEPDRSPAGSPSPAPGLSESTGLDEPATAAQQTALLQVIDEANDLLLQAITQGDEQSLAALGQVWVGSALESIVSFAGQANQRFPQPVVIEYDYISPPTISDQNNSGEIVVTARERWRYDSPAEREEESFEFQYTLISEDGNWVITRYTYRNLAARPTATLTPAASVTPATPTP